MAGVTIEGSRLSPSTFLAAGERVTVQRTKRIDDLIAAGFVVVVDERTTTEREADEQAEQSRADLTPYTLDNPPKRNASREDWSEFLAAHSELGIVTEGKDRDELIAAWDAYLAERVTQE